MSQFEKFSIFVLCTLVAAVIIFTGGMTTWQNLNLSHDFRVYFGQTLPQTPEASVAVEPDVMRELFKAHFELEHSNRYNHARLGSKFFDMCETARKAGFEKEIEAAGCFQPVSGVSRPLF